MSFRTNLIIGMIKSFQTLIFLGSYQEDIISLVSWHALSQIYSLKNDQKIILILQPKKILSPTEGVHFLPGRPCS